jgi:hypothetical protein
VTNPSAVKGCYSGIEHPSVKGLKLILKRDFRTPGNALFTEGGNRTQLLILRKMQMKRLHNLHVSKLLFYVKFAEEYKIIRINTEYETHLVNADDNKLSHCYCQPQNYI